MDLQHPQRLEETANDQKFVYNKEQPVKWQAGWARKIL